MASKRGMFAVVIGMVGLVYGLATGNLIPAAVCGGVLAFGFATLVKKN